MRVDPLFSKGETINRKKSIENIKEKNIFFIFLSKINDKAMIKKKINEFKTSGISANFINQEEVNRRIKPKKNLKFIIHFPGVGITFKKIGFSKIKK